MLEKQDIEIIRSIMQESEERIMERVDQKLQRALRETENGLLEEMDRMRESLEEKIANVDKKVDNLETYYRITKLENDNTSILLKIVGDLQERVTVLEKKTA
ncbi:hypothetical protein [Claveliimonas bilis]|uniref:hypothetical protein n=1 Tax=Clostridia TaxID=186801 RepID=UPI001C3ADFAB|nr:hypothetical protein [Claveliimonas bilis]MCQ5202794.1 hypothetical protein [Mordavella massiliensis]BCZ27346.1 hypothetical protein EUBC25_14330 [Claveliimonas bilis]BDZ80120.1 hypothetical protein Lac3_13290 [Claveliimonas bilis]HIZ59382.1 hypothetical protein [Candidatus Dorea faecipullorum]